MLSKARGKVQQAAAVRALRRAAFGYPRDTLSSMMVGLAARADCGPRTAMQPFRILEHTADIGFEAFGATREEVFANAGRALIHIVFDLESIAAREQVSIEVQGSDSAGLLVNWLSEILFLQDAENWLFRDFEVRELSDRALSAIARGEKFDSARHQAKLLVKAITYHQLVLEQTAEGWRAQVYVDI